VPSAQGHPAHDGGQLPAAGSPALAPVSTGIHSAELAPKAAHAPEPRPAAPSGRPSSLPGAEERPSAHTAEPRGGRPASPPPTSRPHGDAAVSHSPKTAPHIDRPSGLGEGGGPHSTEPSHDGGGHGDNGHGGLGDGDHGGHGDGAGKPPYDPVHSHEPSGDGWERLPDRPPHPHYGEPLDHHWQYPHDPTDPSRIHPDVAKLMKDPDAPFGRDPQGHAYTQHEYEERFNKEGPNREHWYNFASDDGALAGTKVAFHDLERYKDFYGNQLDRIGDENGRYLGVIENGHFASWEERAMHVDMLSKPFHTYTIEKLPEGWKIEVSEIEPAVGQPGGAMQVRILDHNGKPLDVETLIENRVLRDHD